MLVCSLTFLRSPHFLIVRPDELAEKPQENSEVSVSSCPQESPRGPKERGMSGGQGGVVGSGVTRKR